jgi:hypothetical protein
VERQQDQVNAGDEEQEQAHHQIQRRASEVGCLQQYDMCDGSKKMGYPVRIHIHLIRIRIQIGILG